MAPDLALEKLNELTHLGVVLDPMVGSGTVLRQAIHLGHQAIGFDMDPLAVMMTRVWTTAVEDRTIQKVSDRLSAKVSDISAADAHLPWVDDDPETYRFIEFWFSEPQRSSLRRIAWALRALEVELCNGTEAIALDALKLAFSRLIITKKKGASLAWDVSHSRPHKVAESNNFDVSTMFERSINIVRKRLTESPPPGGAQVNQGDARDLAWVEDASVDAVVTSPPYLNAIDYMRGHRLSLVWLGHRLSELRRIRSNSIGAERSPDQYHPSAELHAMQAAMGRLEMLPSRFVCIIERYVQDIRRMMSEVARVLKQDGNATFVVGNSCLRGVFVQNSAAVTVAAQFSGLKLTNETKRSLPAQSRYLPLTSAPLAKRMRTEAILSFSRH